MEMKLTPMATHTVSKNDAGQAITVAVGDMIRLEIEEPSTTGYRWAIDALDQSVLELVGTNLAPRAGVGAGGLRTFAFSAKSPGRTPLRLKLWREWEGDRSVIQWFEVDVIVHH